MPESFSFIPLLIVIALFIKPESSEFNTGGALASTYLMRRLWQAEVDRLAS